MVVEHLEIGKMMEIGKMKKLILLFLIPFFFVFGDVIHAETTIPDKPINGIYDPQHYLSEKVSDELSNFNSNSETQIGIYIVDTLDGKNIEEQANEVARAWKIGYADTNKGALIAVAINDRKFRIETSNELSTILTDSKANKILNSSKSYMKNQDYDGAIIHMIDEIKTVITPKTEEQIKYEEEQYENFQTKVGFSLAFVLSCFLIVIVTLFSLPTSRRLNFLKRSKYDYKGSDKLTPNDYYFQENKTWTYERKQLFWKELNEKRSQYDYRGLDRLCPGMSSFIMNDSWTQERVDEYKKRIKEAEQKDREDRLKRSDYNYKGKNKLYPNDSKFIENTTWTAILISEYLESQRSTRSHYSSGYSSSSSSSYDSSSSSSWSSGDWGGGGFDGGGSSGGW